MKKFRKCLQKSNVKRAWKGRIELLAESELDQNHQEIVDFDYIALSWLLKAYSKKYLTVISTVSYPLLLKSYLSISYSFSYSSLSSFGITLIYSNELEITRALTVNSMFRQQNISRPTHFTAKVLITLNS